VTATKILEKSGKVEGIETKTTNNKTFTFTSEVTVIACGALESARLLMLSTNENHRNGLGNYSGLLGRLFSEHPFMKYSASYPGAPGYEKRIMGRSYQFKDMFRKQGLGGIVFDVYGLRSKERKIRLAFGIEMEPSIDNGLRLNYGELDPFGNPGLHLDLKFTEKDKELIYNSEKLIETMYGKLGIREFTKLEGNHWSHHQIGTTRMADSADNGIVDKNLKVHGVNNLYVLSSSVFVTSGVANPTLTIVALAHRLSDWLTSLS